MHAPKIDTRRKKKCGVETLDHTYTDLDQVEFPEKKEPSGSNGISGHEDLTMAEIAREKKREYQLNVIKSNKAGMQQTNQTKWPFRLLGRGARPWSDAR